MNGYYEGLVTAFVCFALACILVCFCCHEKTPHVVAVNRDLGNSDDEGIALV